MHPSAQAVMSGFQAYAQGGTATMRVLFADDATWHDAIWSATTTFWTRSCRSRRVCCMSLLYHGLWGRRWESAEDPGTRPGSSLASWSGTREA
jgi:hypothetical protein